LGRLWGDKQLRGRSHGPFSRRIAEERANLRDIQRRMFRCGPLDDLRGQPIQQLRVAPQPCLERLVIQLIPQTAIQRSVTQQSGSRAVLLQQRKAGCLADIDAAPTRIKRPARLTRDKLP
jgi:hypothetical protein